MESCWEIGTYGLGRERGKVVSRVGRKGGGGSQERRREGGREGREDTHTYERTVMKVGLVLKKNGHELVRLGPGRDCRKSVVVWEGRKGGREGGRREGRTHVVGERTDR
jgi:hypothetical protein